MNALLEMFGLVEKPTPIETPPLKTAPSHPLGLSTYQLKVWSGCKNLKTFVKDHPLMVMQWAEFGCSFCHVVLEYQKRHVLNCRMLAYCLADAYLVAKLDAILASERYAGISAIPEGDFPASLVERSASDFFKS